MGHCSLQGGMFQCLSSSRSRARLCRQNRCSEERDGIEHVENEVRKYRRLKPLQGTAIPEVIFVTNAGCWMMLGVQCIEGHMYSDEVDAKENAKEEAKRVLWQFIQRRLFMAMCGLLTC